MNGFHDGIAEKSVRMCQTLLGDALIEICVSMVFDTVAATPAATAIGVTSAPIINQMMLRRMVHMLQRFSLVPMGNSSRPASRL
jgi:hypothetical protein